jgi:phospholipid transport system substrate-binding protein
MIKKLCIACCAFLFTITAYANLPSDFVRDNSQKILDIIKLHDGKNTSQIAQQIESTAIPLFDFTHMTKLAVGHHWQSAKPIQQEQLTQAFQKLLMHTYIKIILGFKNAQVIVQPNAILTETGSTTIAIVKVQVILPKVTQYRKKVPVDYMLYNNASDWKIFNISVDGMSLVTIYRNLFNRTITNHGIDGLIQLLQNKNSRLY